jgi:hypothetical protein
MSQEKFTFSQKAKVFSFVLIAIGVIAGALGFMNANSDHYTDDEIVHQVETFAKELKMDMHKVYSDEEIKAKIKADEIEQASKSHYEHSHYYGVYAPLFKKIAEHYHAHFTEQEMKDAFSVERVGDIAVHYFHAKHQRPWSSIMYANFFFFTIALGALFFYAIQYVSQSGWSATILRIPQAMYSYLLVGGGVMLFIIVTAILHKHHLYHWMDESLRFSHMIPGPDGAVEYVNDKSLAGAVVNPDFDKLIAGKAGYLNSPFFLIRAIVYIAGWVLFGRALTKFSVREDNEGGTKWYTKAFKRSAVFAVFFAVTSSMMAWDFTMSIDPHWFSTLYGWFVFSGFWVSAITVMALITVFLKKLGYLPMVNENHFHDYGRMMLAFSNLWTYLWFAQFLLIWYANIPEEVTYYWIRFEEYKVPFLLTLVFNWGVPIIFLMSRDSKRSMGMITFAGILMLVGHALNTYMLIMPGSVGAHWHIGFTEIGIFLGFLGLFIFITLNSLTKRNLVQKNHPMFEESKHHHIY